MDFYALLKDQLSTQELTKDLTPELQETVLKAADKLYSEATATLKNNKEDILNEKRTLKAELELLKTNTAGLNGKTINDFKKLEEDIAKLRANPGDNDEKLKQLQAEHAVRLAALEADKLEILKTADKKLAEAIKEIEILKSNEDKALCLRELKKALSNVNVKEAFMPNLVKSLLLDTSIKEVDGKKVVKFSGTTGNVTFDIAEGITLWAKEPINAIYIGAPKNVGTGVSGSGSAVAVILKKPFNKMTAAEQTTLFRTDPVTYEKARKNANVAIA